MKNQYFGDNRDLFKYDLILQIIKAGLVDQFTFIPMLTKDDDTKQGCDRNRDKAKAGWKNNDLRVFLDKFNDKDKRDIKELQGFLKKLGIEPVIFGDYFYHAEREKYFQEVNKKLLPKSLIFVDPDTGLEPPKVKPTKAHILYSEAACLYEHMDPNSILMIFQYRPLGEKWEDCRCRILGRLKKEVKKSPIHMSYIYVEPVFFFFLARDDSLGDSVVKGLGNYAECYGIKRDRVSGC